MKKENRKSFLNRVSHLPENERMLIEYAYDIAKESHDCQLRDGGERYFEHVRSVAIILMDECCVFESDLIISALIHDIGEDRSTFGKSTKMAYSAWKETAFFRISRIFNERIARITIALTKPTVDGIEITDKDSKDKVYFVGLVNAEDAVVLVKECDRLHNVRSLKTTTSFKIAKTIKETEDKYYTLFNNVSVDSKYKESCSLLLSKIKSEISSLKVSI
jgi:guanosine-3',5'-bis(diphosphate) 3'-pyrophosphohydrolase